MNKIFIDPTYPNYHNNELFNVENAFLNRDGTLLPFAELKRNLESQGIEVNTFDRVEIFKEEDLNGAGYISFGNIDNVEKVKKLNLRPLALFILEPPLVLKKPYELLPKLSHFFEKVFLHNIDGDCYSLDGVKLSSLRKLYWPQPYSSVVQEFWEKREERENAIVIINGHHRPKRLFRRELYSKRIQWGVALKRLMSVDLYGRGWNHVFKLQNIWLPFLLNFISLRKMYKGTCEFKLETMSHYDFALCFENLRMNGYVTEKLFDCFYSGTIPIYMGGDDIERWIPEDCFIDVRKYRKPKDLADFLLSLSSEQKAHYRIKAAEFLRSDQGRLYTSIHQQIFS